MMAPIYGAEYDSEMDALCDLAVAYLRDAQATAEKIRADNRGRGVAREPNTEDVLSQPSMFGGYSASALTHLGEMFLALGKYTLTQGYYLYGQADILPAPYSVKARDEGRAIYYDDFEVVVTERPDTDSAA